MLPVLADQVPLEWAGDIYCIVLHHCHRLADMPRMRAWTQSMERWCNDFAASANYGGVCDVHRLQLHGRHRRLPRCSRTGWPRRAARWKRSTAGPAGEGYYQLGEVRRLRGDADGAFAAFARARALGIDPQPGEALLRCRIGDSDTAWTDLRVALAGEDRLGRMRLLRGAVEVALVRGDLDEAERIAANWNPAPKRSAHRASEAWAAHARGAILVQQGRHAEALDALQAALREYRTSSPGTRPLRSTSGWRWRTRGSANDELAAADAATAENIYAQLGVEPAQVCGSQLAGRL